MGDVMRRLGMLAVTVGIAAGLTLTAGFALRLFIWAAGL